MGYLVTTDLKTGRVEFLGDAVDQQMGKDYYYGRPSYKLPYAGDPVRGQQISDEYNVRVAANTRAVIERNALTRTKR